MKQIFQYINNKTLLVNVIFILLFILSFNSYSQDCIITSKANDILPDKLCAPVSLSWEITYRGVNDGGIPVQIEVDWDDDNPAERINATNTNANPSVREWQITINHTYPDNGNKCNYNPFANLVVNGVVCSSSIQEQSVTVWDKDDENGGIVEITPPVFYVCVGDSGRVRFQDITTFNCVPPNENDVPNENTRWTQWIYGTDYNIANVKVNEQVRAYPYSGNIEEHTGPVNSPTNPNIFTLPVTSPQTATAGQYFEVTLNYWNYCNPYPDSLPITTTARIEIVDYPDATITPAGPFCANHSSVHLHAATIGGTWSGDGITNASSGRFKPSNAGAGDHIITYTVTNASGCAGVDTVIITVWALPSINILPSTNAEVCPNDTLFIDGNVTAGSGSITTHLWTGDVSHLDLTNVQTPHFTSSNQGAFNFTYKVTDSNNCSVSDNMIVSVNPVSANILPNPAEVCADADLIINGNPSGGTGNYISHTWTGDVGFINQTDIQQPTFSSSIPGDYHLTYFVADSKGCTGIDSTIVTVYENPIANAGANDSICGTLYNLHAISSIGTGTWTLSAGVGNTNFSDINDSLSSFSVDSFGSYTLKWKEIYQSLCADSSEVDITFIEVPNSNAGLTDTICGLTYQLKAISSVGIGTWSKISGAGNVSFQSQNSDTTNVNVDAFGSYVFQWKEENDFNCSDSSRVTINFDLVPSPDFSPTSIDDCSGFSITYTNTSIGANSYLWNFGDGETSNLETPSHIFTNNNSTDTTFNITLTTESIYGCVDSINHTVTVHPIPESNYSFDNSADCSPLNLNFTENANGFETLIWDFDDGSPLDTVNNTNHTFINDTTFIQYFNVKLIAISEDNCKDTAMGWVTVYPNPTYDFSISPSSACNPQNANLLAMPGASVYEWGFGDGTSTTGAFNLSHEYSYLSNNDTTFTVNLKTTSFFGCTDSTQKNIILHPKPNAEFTVDTTSGCTPFNINISNTSTNSDFYYWNYGDGNQDSVSNNNFTHQFINGISSYMLNTIRLISETQFGCKDTFEITTTTFPEVISAFLCDTVGCSPLTILFTNQSIGATSYDWNFGDGHTSTNTNSVSNEFLNVSNSDTTFTASLKTTSTYGCTDSTIQNILIHPKPNAEFIVDTTSSCTPFNINITNTSTNADFYYWNYGDGNQDSTNANNFIHQFVNDVSSAVDNDIVLITETQFGCKDTFEITTTTFPEVISAFLCDTVGCSPLTILFTNQSIGATSYEWIFEDNNISSLSNPIHQYTNLQLHDTTYVAKLISTNLYLCTDTFIQQILVYPKPQASFNMSDSVICSPQTIEFTNLSTGVDNSEWNFGDGNTTTNNFTHITHEFSNSQGTPNYYDISLNVSNNYGCNDEYQKQIIVYPAIIANFVSESEGCSPLNIDFYNQSVGAESYMWNFGDASTSTIFNPSHIFVNNSINDTTFHLTLVANSQYNCVDSISKNINVYPTPESNFSATPISQVFPSSTVYLQNLSNTGFWDYIWDFDDGSTSNMTDPNQHQYQSTGTYKISLIVRGFHCSDTSYNEIRIIPGSPIADFDSSAQGCQPLFVQFNNKSVNATEYEWNFGDGTYSAQENPEHTFADTGTFFVSLKAIGYGETDEISNAIITVYPKPTALFAVSPDKVYLPNEYINCFNRSVGASLYMWHFGNGDSSSVENPKYVYEKVGIYSISLTAWSDKNCVDSLIKPNLIEALDGGSISFPNAFTPNPDSQTDPRYDMHDFTNDVFFPIFQGVEDYHLEIYNRWGELLFVSDDLNIGWNGYYHGKLCKQDVYVWKVTGTLSNGEPFVKLGDLTLLR